MPQTRVSRIPDPIGVEGKDAATQATESNPFPTQDADAIGRLAQIYAGGGAPLHLWHKNIQEARFFEHDPNDILDLTGNGTATNIPGGSRFQTNGLAGDQFTGVMRETNRYASDHNSFWAFSTQFTTPTGTGYTEVGPWLSDGKTGVTLRIDANGASLRRYFDSTTPVDDVAIADWNGKPGGTGIFTDVNGDPVVVDFTKRHVILVAGKWLGGATLGVFLYPEGMQNPPVLLHEFIVPNREVTSSLATPNLAVRFVIDSGDTNEALPFESGCWVFGTDADERIPFQSQANSTTTPAAFVGKPVSSIHHNQARISVQSDANGTLTVEWSDDPSFTTNVYSEPDQEYDTAPTTDVFKFARKGEFIRVSYNDGGASTSLNLQTWLIEEPQFLPVKRLKGNLGQGAEVIPTQAAVSVLDGNQTPQQTGGELSDALDASGRTAADVRAFLHLFNGTTWDRAPGNIANGIDVDVTRSALPTGAATAANQQTDALTDAELRASDVPIKITKDTGTWGYHAGTSGTLTVTGNKRVLAITAIALEAGATMTIDGGDTITIPYGSTDNVSSDLSIEPKGNLVDPVIIFTGTDAYFVEYVV